MPTQTLDTRKQELHQLIDQVVDEQQLEEIAIVLNEALSPQLTDAEIKLRIDESLASAENAPLIPWEQTRNRLKVELEGAYS